MIRLATQDDVPAIVEGLYDFAESTKWRELYTTWPSRQTLREFVNRELTNPKSILYVYQDGEMITGFCGVSLSQFYTPPFIKTMFEWGWYGPPRVAASLWRQACNWAKERGVELAGRAVVLETSTPQKITEQMIWRRL